MYALLLPMVMGCVNDAPTPVVEIVSGVDVTTEVSVVGKASDGAVPVISGVGDEAAAVPVETTEASSVGNRGGALAAGAGGFSAPAMGEGSGFCGRPDSPVRFAFSKEAC